MKGVCGRGAGGPLKLSFVTSANMKCPAKLSPPSPHVTSPFVPPLLPFHFWVLPFLPNPILQQTHAYPHANNVQFHSPSHLLLQ